MRYVYVYTRFGRFYIGQPVSFTGYPYFIKGGTGMVTRSGILCTGQSYSEAMSELDSDIMVWSADEGCLMEVQADNVTKGYK